MRGTEERGPQQRLHRASLWSQPHTLSLLSSSATEPPPAARAAARAVAGRAQRRRTRRHSHCSLRARRAILLCSSDPSQAGPRRVSHITVSRRLNEAGLKGCVARRKPGLSDKTIRARLSFAQGYAAMDWTRVLFSDEKIFWGRRILWTDMGAQAEGRGAEPCLRCESEQRIQ